MTKSKMIFHQTLIIATAILFGIGIQNLLEYVNRGDEQIVCQWYLPLSIILTSFLCSLPTLLLMEGEEAGRKRMIGRIVLHFFTIFLTVSACGYLFRWYTDWQEYLPIAVMIVLIYGFVWAAMCWIAKKDEKKINEALKDIQDQE